MSDSRLTSRSIRSFVIRTGRLTAAQASAVERLMPTLGLPYTTTPIDPARVYGRNAPLWLEIGFGNGDALRHMARTYPHVNFLGVEVHTPGIGHLLLGLEEEGLTNVRIVQHDAMEVLEHMLAVAAVARVLLYFPDPWRKKRHFKRRIVQPDFIAAVERVLEDGGLLHCATDWADYAEWMVEHLNAAACLENLSPDGDYVARPEWRAHTRFERRGERLGHDVRDLLLRRRARDS